MKQEMKRLKTRKQELERRVLLINKDISILRDRMLENVKPGELYFVPCLGKVEILHVLPNLKKVHVHCFEDDCYTKVHPEDLDPLEDPNEEPEIDGPEDPEREPTPGEPEDYWRKKEVEVV